MRTLADIVAAAEHEPPEDPGFRASLTRHGAAAAALIVVVSGAFWAVGWFGGDDDATVPVVADAPDTDGGTETDGDADEGDDEGSELGPDGNGGDDDPLDEADAADDGDGAPETDDPDGDDADPDADPDEGDDPDGTDEPAAPTVDPATVSVQVLDGYQADGGAAANAIAGELEDAGYDIVARNPALRYEVTTVLWTEGFEAEGRQVAAQIEAAEARVQPGNLSSDVAVHVVVGEDRG